MFEICTINLNEGNGRQTISYDEETGKLYSNIGGFVDTYTYSFPNVEAAIDAADIMWGNSAWELKWIEHDD